MSKDTWLKLHTSLLTSAKFVNLPSNDHRWAFVCLLLLTKKRLESVPESYLLGHLSVSKRRWKTVRKDLIKCGLLDADGSVNGFNESQLSPDATRMRQMRARNSGRNLLCNSSTDSREQKAEAERESEPTLDFASEKEQRYAERLLAKNGIEPWTYLSNRGFSNWTSQLVDDVVTLYRDSAVSIGPRPPSTFADELEIDADDRSKGIEYLESLNRKADNGS